MNTHYNNNNNNNCLKSNIQCIEIRVQWTVHLGSSHMHVHAVTRVHAVTPKLVICVMYYCGGGGYNYCIVDSDKLGVVLDRNLTMANQVSQIMRICTLQITYHIHYSR